MTSTVKHCLPGVVYTCVQAQVGTWLLSVLLSGYSSLGAIVSALIAPFYVWWFKPQFTFPVSMLSCLILLRHHDNIQRLWRRQETKIWARLKRKKKETR